MTGILNIRDPKTGASVLPQYNLLNLGYSAIKQVFQRIESGNHPEYINTFREQHGVTQERINTQLHLIADLLDGLFRGEYERDDSMTYLEKAMQDCRWPERFDWEAMAVFDMLMSQGIIAHYFLAIADLASESEIQANNKDELREIVENLCRRADECVQKATQDSTRVESCGSENQESGS
jgi:hypothetical protein